MDSIQNFALVYASATAGHFSDEDSRLRAVRDFNIQLLGDALVRLNGVEDYEAVSPLYRQALLLLLFLVVASAVLFSAIALARFYAQGYARRLYLRRLRFGHAYGAYLLLAVTLATLLAALLGLIMRYFDPATQIAQLAASGALLAFVLAPLFFLFSGLKSKLQQATTQTLLGCMALVFFLLFLGGGLYPSFLVETNVRLFNPVWLADMLAFWSLGGSLQLSYLLLALVPVLPCAAIAWYQWRRLL